MLHLLKGKCFDKTRQFVPAVKEYGKALEMSIQSKLEKEIVGQIEFRLGWSTIRSKVDIDQGVQHLRKANEYLPENTEIMIKLAGVLFQENGL